MKYISLKAGFEEGLLRTGLCIELQMADSEQQKLYDWQSLTR